MKRKISIKLKMSVLFGVLFLISTILLGSIVIKTVRDEITKKIEMQLIDKVQDIAEIITGRLTLFFTMLSGMANTPEISSKDISAGEKLDILLPYMKKYKDIVNFGIADNKGQVLNIHGNKLDCHDREWFRSAIKGKNYISNPTISRSSGKLAITVSVPIYDINQKIISVLYCDIDGLWLCKQIEDIKIGEKGACYILNKEGTTIASTDVDLVKNVINHMQLAQTDSKFLSIANSERHALQSEISGIGFYECNAVHEITAYAKMKSTGWTVIIHAPKYEFMEIVLTLRIRLIGIAIIVVLIAIIFVHIVSHRMASPIQDTVSMLKNIAEGEGDLTTRLPVKGNDEITDLSKYFNQTIEKIGNTIQSVRENSVELNVMGQTLSSNMSETATSVNQISTNIEGVKGQVLNQSAGVTEISATMEQIIRTIQQLNRSIDQQVINVTGSLSSVEQMVANIASVTETLAKTDETIKDMTVQTKEGKNTVKATVDYMQQILEESGSLQEAASVIQNIASQTNLLAMNAAIEAAHAGDSGKGFAVVADEIRKLAEESSMQGKAIATSLKNLSTKIQEIAESSKNAEEKFISIFEVAREIKDMSANLTLTMQEQSRGSQQVFTAMKDISTVTAGVKDGSAEMLRGGEQVAEEMRKLDELTRVITDSMNEMASGAVQINNAVQEVNEMSAKNKESIEALTEEVNKFKV